MATLLLLAEASCALDVGLTAGLQQAGSPARDACTGTHQISAAVQIASASLAQVVPDFISRQPTSSYWSYCQDKTR